MQTEIVSITHGNEGIRVHWPDGTASVYANAIYLAEAFVTAMRAKEHALNMAEDSDALLVALVAEDQPETASVDELTRALRVQRASLAEIAKTLA